MFLGSLSESKVLKDGLIGLKGGEALEFREMPGAKGEPWGIQVRHQGPVLCGGGGGSGSSPRGGTGPTLFHFSLVLRVPSDHLHGQWARPTGHV